MKRVLLVRLGAIGDLVFASALLPPFYKAGYQIDWLVDAALADFWTGHKALQRIIPFPKKKFFQALQTGNWFKARVIWRKFYQGFFAHLPPYTLAIDLHGLQKGAFLLKNLPALEKISLGNQEQSFIWGQKTIPRAGEPADFASEYIFLSQTLGLDSSVAQPWLSSSERFSEDFLKPSVDTEPFLIKTLAITETRLLPEMNPRLLLAPFTTRPQKHWPSDYWQTLIKMLLDHHFSISLLGGPADKVRAEALLADLPVQDLVGKTSLSGALQQVLRAQALIGVDTGWTHAALALGRPTLALFASTRPYRRLPKGGVGKILYLPVPCSPCGRKPSCPGRHQQAYPCLRYLTPDFVFSAFLEILL